MTMKEIRPIIATFALIFCVFPLVAQEDQKIVIEITKEVDGEKKTFKGEYNSREEMEADPSYQEFAGGDNQFHFWSDDDTHVFLDLNQVDDLQNHFFQFFDKDDDTNTFFFHGFDSDSDDNSFDFSFDNFDSENFSEELKEKLKNLGVEIEELVDRFSTDDGTNNFKIITLRSIQVTDTQGEFGKKGQVSKNQLLELEDLTFYPNPSKDGRVKVRFSVPDEDDLEIQVSNLEGKEVFSRYFDRFAGYYSEEIDLSNQKEGIYLLEISRGKKRLTKKIVIE